MTERCETCRFWDNAAFERDGVQYGDCRFNPPQIYPEQLQRLILFPHVRRDKWCGKWEARNDQR